ncbi:MAG TPA: hypothetical protein VHZ28_09640 [Terracidiphilus sp.]|nr:hypothetical protein [Terracidiphilus sp.]
MRRFTLISVSALSVLILPLSMWAQPARAASFTINQQSKAVGTASFRIAGDAAGYDVSSTVRVEMQGLNYALSKNEELSSASELKHVQLSATVNDQAVSVTAKPDAAQLLLNISANGRSTTTRLAMHSAAVFLPDFDPGSLETLLTLAVAHNNHDLWAIIPKQAGSVAAISLATYPDQQGTIDGKPIAVHHLVATINGARTDLFAGPENQLLQAELPQPGFVLVRKGFVLKPPAKPEAPAE